MKTILLPQRMRQLVGSLVVLLIGLSLGVAGDRLLNPQLTPLERAAVKPV